MVFSTIPAYLDPPNWQQLPNHQAGDSSANNPQLQPVTSLPSHVGGGPGAASMTERARLANIPMPEAVLKCPRCESSSTKFCYFNNYNLTQPRHFCKTCRRYWTRGGALRNVPVGGGFRRNKRTKATSSKSSVSSDRQTSSSSTSTVSSTGPASILGLTPQIPPLRFLSSLSQLTHDHYSAAGDFCLNYGRNNSSPVMGTSEMNFQMVPNNLLGYGIGGGVISLLSSGGGNEQWRLQQAQQFPFLGGLMESPPAGIFSQFQASTAEPSVFVGETSHQVRPKLSTPSLTQQASVKMEENHQELNLTRQLAGIPGNDLWNSTAAAWTTDLTSFSSSSTNNAL